MKNRKVLSVIISLVLGMIFSMPVFAAEKVIPVGIDKDYDACQFSITLSQKGDYVVELINPRGEEYEKEIDNDDSCAFIVKDVFKGDWSVRVSTKETEIVSEDQEASEDTSKEGISEESKEGSSEEAEPKKEDKAIGKVKVSVRGVDTSNYTVDEIKVAKDIVGLNMYFVDDVLHVEWEDSSVGKVVVSVTDTQTQAELGKETIDSRSYECTIPKSTNEVTVALVPSTSTKVESAKSQYTVVVPELPLSKVTFEDLEYTNKDTIQATISSEKKYSYRFFTNGNQTLEEKDVPAGEKIVEVPIVENDNVILVYTIDENGNMFSTKGSVIRDSIQPILSTEVDYNGRSTYSDVVTFKGSVSDYSAFYVNDVETKVSGDGVWITEYELHEGENRIVFKAVDLAGNEAVIDATVTKLIEEKKPFPWIPVISVAVILLGGLGYLFYMYKTAGNGRYNNIIDEKENTGFIAFCINYFKGLFKKSDAPKKEKPKKESSGKGLSVWQKDILFLGLFAIVVFAFFKFILTPGLVPSGSMEPTLMTGDRILVNRLSYIVNEPQRGDVVAFYSEEYGEVMIKRIIGLPGDNISFTNGYVYINDALVYEEYIDESIESNCADEFNVPDGCYFVMGDNRENSVDSRFFANPYISKESILGKFFCRLYDKDFGLKNIFG